MLRRLTVENLLLIERAELELAPGLNVITGETGAGKTLLATGLGLLLGDRSRSGLVRPGADDASIEGVFDIPEALEPDLRSFIPDGSEQITLTRRVWPDGRSRAQICGRTTTVSDLKDLASALIAFHGQHEHRRLTLSRFQLETLDSACGPGQSTLRKRALEAHGAVAAATADLEALSAGGAGGQRELDLLRWELQEIEEADPRPGEAERLREERDRLAGADRIRQALEALGEALSPADGADGVSDAIAANAKALDSLRDVDPSLGELAERLGSIGLELDDIRSTARGRLDSLDASPGRIAEVELRLDVIAGLERKHGGTVESALQHAARCRERLSAAEDLEGAIERAESALDRARDEQESACAELTAARIERAGRLSGEVEAVLADLALDTARFEIAVRPSDRPGPTGADRVEFLVAPNAGLEPTPLGETASGGEISRVLLALLSVAYSARSGVGRLLVFDEIDAGLGGRTAVAVGSRLAALAGQSQVLCITHLAPVAARAERHFTIDKRVRDGVALTVVETPSGDALIEEMVRMLGAAEGDEAARAHAAELLAAASGGDAA